MPRVFHLTSLALLCLTSVARSQPHPGDAYDFSYRVSGDRRVAPVQVFDDGRNTYVQFKTGQTVPAIFTADAQGERLAAHTVSGAYVVITGVGHALVMRIGGVTAQARYEGTNARVSSATSEDSWPQVQAPSQAASYSNGSWQESAPAPARIAARSVTSARRPAFDAPREMPMPTHPQADASFAPRPMQAAWQPAPASLTFDASLSDQNMRRVLTRWARAAGWIFEPEHWTVDVDIPLAGSASFGSDFKGSVRALLSSTELSARPLQPCFYSNNVMRVIGLAEQCDRTVTVSASR